MDEYKKQGGTLNAVSGSEQRTEEFEGCPKGVSTHSQGVSTHSQGVSTHSQGENINRSGSSSTSSGKQGQGIGSADAAKKPSIIDKLNPFKDSDGDGNSGFMK
jgi:type 1 fimbria pilin